MPTRHPSFLWVVLAIACPGCDELAAMYGSDAGADGAAIDADATTTDSARDAAPIDAAIGDSVVVGDAEIRSLDAAARDTVSDVAIDSRGVGCAPGYIPLAGACVIDNCAQHSNGNGGCAVATVAECLNTRSGRECRCRPGYTGSGFSCRVCVADCSGRVCGDDGCGRSCGACSVGTCNVDGQCVSEPLAVPPVLITSPWPYNRSFARSVALSSNGMRLAVGDADTDADRYGCCNGGGVALYDWESNAWTLRAIHLNGYGDFGESISLSGDGDTLVVGDPEQLRRTADVERPGEVSTFRPATDSASEERLSREFSNIPSEDFGNAVALSTDGTRMVVGDRGLALVEVFVRQRAGWESLARTQRTPDIYERLLGHHVAISADGRVALAGDPGVRPQPYPYPAGGSVEVLTPDDPFQPRLTITGPQAPGGSRRFGTSVAISADGNTIVVGDPEGGLISAGHAVVFLRAGRAVSQVAVLRAPRGATSFGDMVAISADARVLAVADFSANHDYDVAQHGSSVTIFRRSDVNSPWSVGAILNFPRADAMAMSSDGRTLALAFYHEELVRTYAAR